MGRPLGDRGARRRRRDPRPGPGGEIDRAWDARGGGYADTVTRDGAETFLQRLARAATLCERAADAAPRGPVVWVPLLWPAIGQSAPHATFRRRWDALVTRDPHNRQGHVAALQYWCAKWHGSNDEMLAFARDAARRAPDGWAAVLPLQAHIEWNLAEENEGLRRSLGTVRTWETSPEIRADIDAALAWAETAPTHAMALHDLSVVAYALVRASRFVEADALLAGLGYRVSAYPWDYDSRSPEKAFRPNSSVENRRRSTVFACHNLLL